MNLWSYSGTYIPGVFSYGDGGYSEEHEESDSSYAAELLEGDTGGEDESGKDDEILDEDLDFDEALLADAPDVQLSTRDFNKYESTKPGVLERHQIQCKMKCERFPLSYCESNK